MTTKKNETTQEILARVADIQKKNEAFMPVLMPSVLVLVRAVFDGIDLLDEKSQSIVMKHLGKVCARITREQRIESGAPLPTRKLSIDELPAAMVHIAQFGMDRPVFCRKEGDTIIFEDPIATDWSQCCCRLVLAGFADSSPKMCKMCEAGYYEEYMESMTGQKPIKIETTGFTCGSEFCTGKTTFAPEKK